MLGASFSRWLVLRLREEGTRALESPQRFTCAVGLPVFCSVAEQRQRVRRWPGCLFLCSGGVESTCAGTRDGTVGCHNMNGK